MVHKWPFVLLLSLFAISRQFDLILVQEVEIIDAPVILAQNASESRKSIPRLQRGYRFMRHALYAENLISHSKVLFFINFESIFVYGCFYKHELEKGGPHEFRWHLKILSLNWLLDGEKAKPTTTEFVV